MPLTARLRIGSLLAISSAAFFVIGRFTAPHPVPAVLSSNSVDEQAVDESAKPVSGKESAAHEH